MPDPAVKTDDLDAVRAEIQGVQPERYLSWFPTRCIPARSFGNGSFALSGTRTVLDALRGLKHDPTPSAMFHDMCFGRAAGDEPCMASSRRPSRSDKQIAIRHRTAKSSTSKGIAKEHFEVSTRSASRHELVILPEHLCRPHLGRAIIFNRTEVLLHLRLDNSDCHALVIPAGGSPPLRFAGSRWLTGWLALPSSLEHPDCIGSLARRVALA